jgi:hypothetical protein
MLVRMVEQRRPNGLLDALGSNLDRLPAGEANRYRELVSDAVCPPARRPSASRVRRIRVGLLVSAKGGLNGRRTPCAALGDLSSPALTRTWPRLSAVERMAAGLTPLLRSRRVNASWSRYSDTTGRGHEGNPALAQELSRWTSVPTDHGSCQHPRRALDGISDATRILQFLLDVVNDEGAART